MSDGTREGTEGTRRRGHRVWRILGALGLAAFLGVAIPAHFIDRYGQGDRARPANAIVVLGARVDERGEPGDSLRARTLHAVSLYKRGLAPKILCTGGIGDYPPSEAAAAAALARAHGVPAADLFLEEQSTSTRENALYAAKICREQGWGEVIVRPLSPMAGEAGVHPSWPHRSRQPGSRVRAQPGAAPAFLLGRARGVNARPRRSSRDVAPGRRSRRSHERSLFTAIYRSFSSAVGW